MDMTRREAIDESLTPVLLREIEAYWRAANYLSVGQIYLLENPLLKEPLKLEHIKPGLLGHWGTTPGLNFIYVHFNRLIKPYDLNVIYITVHGGLLLKNLRMLDSRDYSVEVPEPGQVVGEATRVMRPDETKSNRLGALFEVTNRPWMAQALPEDDHLCLSRLSLADSSTGYPSLALLRLTPNNLRDWKWGAK